MLERDIWIAANALIKLYGDEAPVHAAIRADALLEQGDGAGYATWKRVLAAINELNNSEPAGKPN